MKWDIKYTRESTGVNMWYSQDKELNHTKDCIEAPSAEIALLHFKEILVELMGCNALAVEHSAGGITVFEPSDSQLIERYFNFSVSRVYQLIDETGEPHLSHTPGTLGGHRKLKIYGKLDCPSAIRHIAKGQYIQHRVFFLDENTAIAAGYRPCGICMREEYQKWKSHLQEKHL